MVECRQGAAERLDALDWTAIVEALHARGFAVASGALTPVECADDRALYAQERLFRSRIVMARHGFGQGEYQYFAYPLPEPIAALRQTLYSRLAPIANVWSDALGLAARYPVTLDQFLATCHAQGQMRPTPLLLKYGAGDYNRLHQDLYGGVQFPLQAAVLLSAPGDEFEGGEFVLTEAAPRKQTRAEMVPLSQGDMVIFAVNNRPQKSAKGYSRVAMRHGVSTIRRGERTTLGVILHDAT
ncbi:MAG: 2OG-Fe(II) oxygenase [Alphaproteobacteria bacterium]|nr:2OG-Fe(II) oxygenase [Alphaproteobacteria bacterium]